MHYVLPDLTIFQLAQHILQMENFPTSILWKKIHIKPVPTGEHGRPHIQRTVEDLEGVLHPSLDSPAVALNSCFHVPVRLYST